MSVRSTIASQLREVAVEHERTLAPLTDELKLLESGLDSLGVGIALPAVSIPLLPLLITVSVTTTIFTIIGLAFGARLGERYEARAERVAGALLVVLAVSFSIERLL